MSFFDIVFGPDASGYPRIFYWLKGISFSLELTFLAALLGLIIGIVLSLMKSSNFYPFKMCKGKIAKFNPLSFIATIYIDVIRGTPTMVQILFVNLVVFAAIDIPILLVGAVAFGVNSGAYVAEIIRAGIQALDKGQMEAARSLGMTYKMAMKNIIIPQAVKNILPALVSEFIVLLKETAVVGYIGGFDITKASSTIISQTFTANEPLLTAALIYFILVSIFTGIMRKVERRLRVSDSR